MRIDDESAYQFFQVRAVSPPNGHHATASTATHPAKVKSVFDSHSFGDAATRLYEGGIENAPMMIGSIGSGIAGKVIAEGLAKTGATIAEKVAAGRYGLAIGAGSSSVGMEVGSIYGDIYDETGKMRPGVALVFLISYMPQLGVIFYIQAHVVSH